MRPWRFSHAGVLSCFKPQYFLLHDSSVLLDGSRTPHLDRLKSRVLRMDAWKPHLTFPWAPRDNAGLICWLWGELPRGLS